MKKLALIDLDEVNKNNGKYHKRGIEKKLYSKVESLNNDNFFTVNSSLYAHEGYKHLGFIDIDKEQNVNDLRFYPMKKDLNISLKNFTKILKNLRG